MSDFNLTPPIKHDLFSRPLHPITHAPCSPTSFIPTQSHTLLPVAVTSLYDAVTHHREPYDAVTHQGHHREPYEETANESTFYPEPNRFEMNKTELN